LATDIADIESDFLGVLENYSRNRINKRKNYNVDEVLSKLENVADTLELEIKEFCK
jgi:hypothetical protein